MAAGGFVNIAKEQASGFLNLARNAFTSIMPNGLREKALENPNFPHSKPILFLFIASQILSSIVPALFLLVLCITVIIFVIVAGLLFVVTCVSFVLLVLVPALLLAGSLALFAWGFGVGAYTVVGAIIRLVASQENGGSSKEHQN